MEEDSNLNKKIGMWTILKKGDKIKGKQYYFCHCDCGNEKQVSISNLLTGRSKNCGCQRHFSKTVKVNLGERYGRLVVLEKVKNPHPEYDTKAYFRCKCDCGNEKITSSESLRTGKCQSCGCIRKEYLDTSIIGKKYGKLTPIKFEYMKGNDSYWRCKCDCGNEKILSRKSFLFSGVFSCGCLSTSHISLLTEQYLNKNASKIYKIVKEKTFKELINPKTNRHLYFDFAITFKHNVIGLIEVDGIQHLKDISFFSKNKYSSFKERQDKDKIKTEYAKNNKIPFLRLSYTDFDKNENYKNKIQNFLNTLNF